MKIVLWFLLIGTVVGQSLRVEKVSKMELNGAYYHARFINNDELVLTSANYSGLYIYDLKGKSITTVTDERGAGFNYAFDENNLYFRGYEIRDGLKYYSLKKFDMRNGRTETLEDNLRGLSAPVVKNNKLLYSKNGLLNTTGSLGNEIFVTNENSQINLHIEGQVKILSPFGKGVYVWPDLSPDKSKIVFTYGTIGSVIIDTDGNILDKLGADTHFAHWSPNGRFILYMKDIDDGRDYIESDIYVYDTINKEHIQVTYTKERLEFYPMWSPDGKRAVFNDLNGNVYITRFTMEGESK